MSGLPDKLQQLKVLVPDDAVSAWEVYGEDGIYNKARICASYLPGKRNICVVHTFSKQI